MKVKFLIVIVMGLFILACSLTGNLAEISASATPSEIPVAQTTPTKPEISNPITSSPIPIAIASPTIPIPQASLTIPIPTASPINPGRSPLVYYRFVDPDSINFPAGSVEILPGTLVLGPAPTGLDRGPDPSSNIQSSLTAMLDDPRNVWKTDNLAIDSIQYQNGAVNVDLMGEIQGTGDVVLIAARTQIILTVFAEPSVQAAIVTLNGKNIANLGISHSAQAQPENYQYTRKDIEAILKY